MGADIFGDIWRQLSPSDGLLALEDASSLVQIAQVCIDLQSTLQCTSIFGAIVQLGLSEKSDVGVGGEFDDLRTI